MGADRKGPLAAFVVIAVIAAILLVTSVRSQAEPSIVASPPMGSDPALWTSVGDEVGEVVQAGVTLVHKATSDPTRVSDPAVTSAAAGATLPNGTRHVAPPVVPSVVHRVVHVVRHQSTRPNRPRVAHESAPVTTPVPASSPAATTGHGRHLGWFTGHGHGRHLGWAKHGS